MSFILEALKKSENERQRKIGPSLADVQMRPRQSEKPWWAFAVGALLLLNLGVLLVVLIRDGDAQPAQAAQQQSPAVQQAPAIATTPPAASRNTSIAATPPPARPIQRPAPATSPPMRSLADEANVDPSLEALPADQSHLAAAATVPQGPPIVRPIEGPAVAPTVIRPGASQPPPAEPVEVLPTVRDLAASGTNLPDLHLDIHVHSPNPAERFVFVNMRKYIEGQTLSEGPRIERITRDGVILNHQGLRFLLPRQ